MFNQTFIIGNVGQEPELKQIGTGQVCNFSVAVSNNYLDKQGNKQQKTEWFNVSAFGKLAEVCANYCKKGKQVFIVGEIKTNKWEDKNGNKRETISLIAQKLKLLGGKESSQSSGNFQPENNPNMQQEQPFDDGIPFN